MNNTILVVEDEPLNIKLIRDILTHRGDTVFAGPATAEKALIWPLK